MAHSTAVPGLLRRINERTVFDAIRAHAPVSRAELARETGISKPTISLTLRALVERGLVRETAHDTSRPHYGAVYYEADPDAAFVLGVDFGARSVRSAVCDLAGEVRADETMRGSGSVEERVQALASTCRSLLREGGVPAGLFECAVVGVPAVVSPADGRISDADLPGPGGADLRGLLERELRVPVTLENDVNLAAVAEQRQGVARGSDAFAFLLVGAGLGAAIVLGGTLHRGHNGAAGELDAVRSGRADDHDPCAAAVVRHAADLAAEQGAAVRSRFTVRELFAAARAGDPLAAAVVDEAARRIALHVVPLAATLDLPLVVLGGSVGANPELLEPIRRRLREWLPFPPRVEVSALGETAVLNGALAAGLDAALEHVFARRLGA